MNAREFEDGITVGDYLMGLAVVIAVPLAIFGAGVGLGYWLWG